MTYIYSVEQSNCFWTWLQSSNSYKNNHSYDGARAIFEYYEQLAEDLGEPIEFDPIAWCCDWTEYESLEDELFKSDYPDIESIEDLEEKTQVISQSPLIFQNY